jgi:hypothetical protein
MAERTSFARAAGTIPLGADEQAGERLWLAFPLPADSPLGPLLGVAADDDRRYVLLRAEGTANASSRLFREVMPRPQRDGPCAPPLPADEPQAGTDGETARRFTPIRRRPVGAIVDESV